MKWHIHTNEDMEIRQIILDLMCRHEAVISQEMVDEVKEKLEEPIKDQLVYFDGWELHVTEKGQLFVRIIW